MRIELLRDYMFKLLDTMLANKKYDINVDFLDLDINNYSLNKIPVESEVQKFVTGTTIYQDTYTFTSKKAYSADVDNNLSNIGFYEQFEQKIRENNRKGILPKIKGIQSIECLNCGALSSADMQECIFSIQIRITYREENKAWL